MLVQQEVYTARLRTDGKNCNDSIIISPAGESRAINYTYIICHFVGILSSFSHCRRRFQYVTRKLIFLLRRKSYIHVTIINRQQNSNISDSARSDTTSLFSKAYILFTSQIVNIDQKVLWSARAFFAHFLTSFSPLDCRQGDLGRLRAGVINQFHHQTSSEVYT